MGSYRVTPKDIEDEKQLMAMKLFDSQRGKFLIGQALYLAIEQLESVPPMRREVSNIAHMRLLQTIFFPYGVVVEAQKKMNETKEG